MDIKRTVEIIFQGNDQTSKTVREIAGSFDTLGEGITSLAEPFSKLADGVLVADAALVGFAVGGMALAISKSTEFETAFAEISTLIHTTSENIDSFREDILEYGRDSSKSLADVNAAIYTSISAGVDYRQSLQVLGEAEKLAVAGVGELEATVRLIASTLNAYGESTDQASRYSNAFFNAINLGQTRLPELADSLSRVTGVAAAAGIPIEDLTGAIVGLTSAGMPTAEAMTGLKAVISAVLAPSEEAKKIFESLGVQYGESAIKAKGLDGVLREMNEATGGNAEQMKKMLGGIEGLNAGMILAEDKAGKYHAALIQMRSGQDVVTEAFQKMADTVELVNQRLSNNLDILLIQVGDRLTGAYTGIASGVVEIFQGMQDAVEAGAFNELFEAIKQWSAEVEAFLKAVAENLPEAFAAVDFDNLISALKALGREFGLLFEDVDLTTPEGLADAIQGAVDTIESLVRVTTGMVQEFKPIFDAIREGIGDFNDLGDASQTEFGKVLGAAKLVTEAGVLVAGAITMIAQSGASMRDVFDATAGSIKMIWNVLQVAFDQIVLTLAICLDNFLAIADGATLLLSPFSDVNDRVNAARESVKGFIEAVKENQFQNMSDVIEGSSQAWDGFSGKATEAKEAAKAAGETIQDAFPENKEVNVEIDPEGNIPAAGEAIVSAIPEECTTEVVAQVDDGSVATAKAALEDAVPAEQTSTVQVQLDDGSLLLTNKKIEEGVPAEQTTYQKVIADDGSILLTNRTLDDVAKEREVPIKATVDEEALKKTEKYLIEEMKAQADLLETTIEWKAKIDIAAITAEAEKVKAAFESTSTTIESTGKTLQTIFEEWSGLDFQGRWEARKALEQELELQREAAEVQKKMVEEQIKLSELKREAIQRGDGLIKVDSTGLEPALELVLWQILQKVQVRATEEASEFLLGL